MICSREGALASTALEQALGLFWIGVGGCRQVLAVCWRSLHVRSAVALAVDDGGLGAVKWRSVWGDDLAAGRRESPSVGAVSPRRRACLGCPAGLPVSLHFTTSSPVHVGYGLGAQRNRCDYAVLRHAMASSRLHDFAIRSIP